MKLEREFEPIMKWAADRKIIPDGNAKTQTIKLGEEFGELCKAVNSNNFAEARDALGDMVVVMVSLAYHVGSTLEQSINAAYDEIKDRKGEMRNGDFFKDTIKS